MTWHVFFVEKVIVHLNLRVCFEIIWHQHNRDLNVAQFIDRVVDPPHEDAEQRVAGPEQLHFLRHEVLLLRLGFTRQGGGDGAGGRHGAAAAAAAGGRQGGRGRGHAAAGQR